MVTSQIVYDPIRAEQAVKNLEMLLQSIDSQVVTNTRPNLDMGMVAIILLSVGEYAAKPDVRRVFQLLPPEVFPIKHLDMIPDLAWAAWHTKLRYDELIASRITATVPADLAQRVSERKQRMLKVVEYHLMDNPKTSLAVQALRSGTGHQDDASDLAGLANLFQANKKVLVGDTKWYREDDIQEAKQDSTALMRLLGIAVEDDIKQAWDLLTRIFICALESYEEVRLTATYLFRHRPEVLEHFPIIYTAVRRPKAATRSPEELVPAVQPPTAPQTPPATVQPVQPRTSGSRGPFVE